MDYVEKLMLEDIELKIDMERYIMDISVKIEKIIQNYVKTDI